MLLINQVSKALKSPGFDVGVATDPPEIFSQEDHVLSTEMILETVEGIIELNIPDPRGREHFCVAFGFPIGAIAVERRRGVHQRQPFPLEGKGRMLRVFRG